MRTSMTSPLLVVIGNTDTHAGRRVTSQLPCRRFHRLRRAADGPDDAPPRSTAACSACGARRRCARSTRCASAPPWEDRPVGIGNRCAAARARFCAPAARARSRAGSRWSRTRPDTADRSIGRTPTVSGTPRKKNAWGSCPDTRHCCASRGRSRKSVHFAIRACKSTPPLLPPPPRRRRQQISEVRGGLAAGFTRATATTPSSPSRARTRGRSVRPPPRCSRATRARG